MAITEHEIGMLIGAIDRASENPAAFGIGTTFDAIDEAVHGPNDYEPVFSDDGVE